MAKFSQENFDISGFCRLRKIPLPVTKGGSMKKFAISCSAGADLDINYVVAHDIQALSMRYLIEEGVQVVTHSYGSGEPELGLHEFYELIKTCAYARSISNSEQEMLNHFTSIYNANSNGAYDNKFIIHFAMLSMVSSNYQNAKVAAFRFNQTHPDGRVVVIDTKQMSHGLAVIIDAAVKLRDDDYTQNDAVEWIEKNKFSFCTYMTINDPFCLRRSGRAPYLLEFLGGDLGMKPIFRIDDEGKVSPIDKHRTRRETIYRLFELFKSNAKSHDGKVFIGHADCKEDAEQLRALIEKYASYIHVGFMGPIIGISSGPGSLAISFVGKAR
jgi:DegV family protein with EDD domain